MDCQAISKNKVSFSTNLKPLNYFLKSFAMIQVRRQKPATLDELEAIVENAAASQFLAP